jgi:hypothetical protein
MGGLSRPLSGLRLRLGPHQAPGLVGGLLSPAPAAAVRGPGSRADASALRGKVARGRSGHRRDLLASIGRPGASSLVEPICAGAGPHGGGLARNLTPRAIPADPQYPARGCPDRLARRCRAARLLATAGSRSIGLEGAEQALRGRARRGPRRSRAVGDAPRRVPSPRDSAVCHEPIPFPFPEKAMQTGPVDEGRCVCQRFRRWRPETYPSTSFEDSHRCHPQVARVLTALRPVSWALYAGLDERCRHLIRPSSRARTPAGAWPRLPEEIRAETLADPPRQHRRPGGADAPGDAVQLSAGDRRAASAVPSRGRAGAAKGRSSLLDYPGGLRRTAR